MSRIYKAPYFRVIRIRAAEIPDVSWKWWVLRADLKDKMVGSEVTEEGRVF